VAMWLVGTCSRVNAAHTARVRSWYSAAGTRCAAPGCPFHSAGRRGPPALFPSRVRRVRDPASRTRRTAPTSHICVPHHTSHGIPCCIFCTRPVLSVCPSPPARAIAGSASGHLSRASHPAPRPLNSALQHGVLTSARPSVSIALGPLMAVSCGTSISSLSSPTLTSAAVWHGGCIHMCAIHAPWDA